MLQKNIMLTDVAAKPEENQYFFFAPNTMLQLYLRH